jgi:hypothetical protein
MDDYLKALSPWDPNGSLSSADADRIWASYKAAGGGRDVSKSLAIGGGLPSGDGGQFTGVKKMDMNANAGAPSMSPGATPSYLQQQPSNPTWAGGAANMIKALMQGNNNFNRRAGASPGMPPAPATTTGGPSVGAPMLLAPPAPQPMMQAGPVDPTAMSGGMMPPPMPKPPMMGGDPTANALFSPIPGEYGGSQFGG